MQMRRTLRRMAARVRKGKSPFLPRGRGAWVAVEANPAGAVAPPFRFFGVVGTWMESDIVEAVVRNALTQGVERVYLIDNDSPDDTVRVAEAAGAVLGGSFTTTRADGQARFDAIRALVQRESEASGAEHVWWLYMDADEFCRGPGGLTLREYLDTLDGRFRVVGADVLDHFPDSKPENIPGFHPIDFQPLCQRRPTNRPCGHWKHPLLRFDRNGPPVQCGRGFHRAVSTVYPLLEPATSVLMHHFQYRAEEATRRRMERLCAPGPDGSVRTGQTDSIALRWKTIDDVYAQNWDALQHTKHGRGVTPEHWQDVLGPEHHSFPRWYSPDDLDVALHR